MKRIKTKIIYGIFLLYFFCPSLSLAATPAPIYISQIQITGGKNNTGEDFVELFNPNSLPINLKGSRLVKRSQGGNSDILMKSWGKDTFVPPKSFYLWANSGYASIAVKPDVTSTATISPDNGVALRFGANDTGQIIDSLAWGKSGNAFNNVSAINPGAGQSIFRKNLEAAESAYYIAASQPHNSSQNDLAAAFGQSQTFEPVSTTKANPVAKVAVATSSSTQAIVASSSPVEGEGGVTEILNIQATSTLNTNFQSRQNKSAGIKYLILSVLAFLTLILVVYTSFFKKKE